MVPLAAYLPLEYFCPTRAFRARSVTAACSWTTSSRLMLPSGRPCQALRWRLTKLADGLERLGLAQARIALLFLMGREDTLRQDGLVPPEETPEGYQEFFEHWSS